MVNQVMFIFRRPWCRQMEHETFLTERRELMAQVIRQGFERLNQRSR